MLASSIAQGYESVTSVTLNFSLFKFDTIDETGKRQTSNHVRGIIGGTNDAAVYNVRSYGVVAFCDILRFRSRKYDERLRSSQPRQVGTSSAKIVARRSAAARRRAAANDSFGGHRFRFF